MDGDLGSSHDLNPVLQHDFRGINLGVKRKHPDLSPIRRAVLLVWHAVRSAPFPETARLLVRAVRHRSHWVHLTRPIDAYDMARDCFLAVLRLEEEQRSQREEVSDELTTRRDAFI